MKLGVWGYPRLGLNMRPKDQISMPALLKIDFLKRVTKSRIF